MARASRSGRQTAPGQETAQRIADAVRGVSRFVADGSHCLSQAIATQILLKRRGIDAEICFGVSTESSKDFSAHAWVESGGVVVIGDPGPRVYTRLEPTMAARPDPSPSDRSPRGVGSE